MRALSTHDELLREATVAAAERVAPLKDSFLEKYLEEALIEGIGLFEPKALCRATGHFKRAVPHWTGNMRDHDISIWLEAREGPPPVIVETKVYDVDQTLWDLFKLIAAQSQDGIEASYLVVASTTRVWDSTKDCVELFVPSRETRTRRSLDLFEQWAAAWRHLLAGGPARPLRVPSYIETRFLAQAQVHAFPDYEVRCIGVSAVDDVDWVEFDGDWPAQASKPLRGRA